MNVHAKFRRKHAKTAYDIHCFIYTVYVDAYTDNGTIKDSMIDTDGDNDVDYNDEHSTDSSDDETCSQHIKNVRTMSKRVVKITGK
jgi:hypothetical protein